MAVSGRAERFITLTCDPALHASPEDAARVMVEAFPEFVRAIRKELGRQAFEYLWVFEATKAGWPHIHVLQRGRFVGKHLVRRIWHALTGARVVDIRTVDNPGRVAGYVAKYIGKEPHRFGTGRRYGRSRDWCGTKAERMAERGIGGGAFYADFRERVEIAAEWAREGYATQWKGETLYGLRPDGLPP